MINGPVAFQFLLGERCADNLSLLVQYNFCSISIWPLIANPTERNLFINVSYNNLSYISYHSYQTNTTLHSFLEIKS